MSIQFLLKQLENYNKHDEIPQLEKYSDNLFFTSLFITKNCNFNCNYCFYGANAKANEFSQDVSWSDYVKFFNSEGKIWLINMTGGEPFMYKDIYQLVSELTKKHFVGINSNMTLIEPNILIGNSHCTNLFINASYHYKILESNTKLKNKWKDSFLEIKQSGIGLASSIVVYPKDFKYIMVLYEQLLKEGITPVNLLTYKGYYKRRVYPESYSLKQKKELLTRTHGFIKASESNFYENFELKNCLSGYKGFTIDHKGNINHCDAINISYGTIFKPNLFNNQNIACPLKDKCRFSLQGLLLTSKK